MKHCFKCGERKHLSDFYKHSAMADGHLNKCKECAKRDVSTNYKRRKPYYQNYYRQRDLTGKRKALRRVMRQHYREKYPERRKAHTAVSNAVRDNRMRRQICEVCGAFPAEAHHDDYKKPLEVRWLCFTHHRQIHGQLQP